MATTMVLRENVLTDDILRVADNGKCFGRTGPVAQHQKESYKP